jgi:uncharacterized protein YfiM (DUF2279 family)
MMLKIALLATVLAQPVPPDPWFGEDKLKHLFNSFVATSMAASGARLFFDQPTSLYVGGGMGAGAGVLKEVHDARTGGIFSIRDLVWDAAGVVAAVALLRSGR